MDYPPANLTALKQIARGYQNTGSDCSWQEVERAIAEIERLRAYEKEWLAALDACSWMHDDKTLEVPLGRRLTVEGVAALRKQRDELRRNQFRWIPVGEKMPGGRVFFLRDDLTVGCADFAQGVPRDATHVLPIPPLPERSQADRDDEMLRVWIKSLGAEHTDRENSLRIGYLEGLKAAREQKTP